MLPPSGWEAVALAKELAERGVICTMPDGETTKMKPNVATVVGKLFVGELKEDDVVIALYTMEVEKVE